MVIHCQNCIVTEAVAVTTPLPRFFITAYLVRGNLFFARLGSR